jgi:hypothetical protein
MDKINRLGPTEHLEILKILEGNAVASSSNANGVFFNLTTIPESVYQKIETFVNYCCDNKRELDEYDKKIHECKYRNNIDNIVRTYDIESSIKEPSKTKDNWKDLIEKVDKTGNIKDFFDKLESSIDRSNTKRVNSKFAVAKKKFAKRSCADNEMNDCLEEEAY